MIEYLSENARLRQLARRYAEGQLSQEEYRAARREIIEALEAGRAQADAEAPIVADTPVARAEPITDADGVSLPEDMTVFFKTTPPQSLAENPSSSELASGWDAHTRVLAIVLGISLLLAVSALVYVFAL